MGDFNNRFTAPLEAAYRLLLPTLDAAFVVVNDPVEVTFASFSDFSALDCANNASLGDRRTPGVFVPVPGDAFTPDIANIRCGTPSRALPVRGVAFPFNAFFFDDAARSISPFFPRLCGLSINAHLASVTAMSCEAVGLATPLVDHPLSARVGVNKPFVAALSNHPSSSASSAALKSKYFGAENSHLSTEKTHEKARVSASSVRRRARVERWRRGIENVRDRLGVARGRRRR